LYRVCIEDNQKKGEFKMLLESIHDKAKSFYGKAKVIEVGDKRELYSYDTLVAVYDKKTNVFYVNHKQKKWDSQTSLRHICEFFYQMVSPTNKLLKTDLDNFPSV